MRLRRICVHHISRRQPRLSPGALLCSTRIKSNTTFVYLMRNHLSSRHNSSIGSCRKMFVDVVAFSRHWPLSSGRRVQLCPKWLCTTLSGHGGYRPQLRHALPPCPMYSTGDKPCFTRVCHRFPVQDAQPHVNYFTRCQFARCRSRRTANKLT